MIAGAGQLVGTYSDSDPGRFSSPLVRAKRGAGRTASYNYICAATRRRLANTKLV